MNPPSLRRSRFLSDLPAEEDSLGPHRQIAVTLKEVVLADRGGHVVGLTGAYGSGKSTVIRILQGLLRGDENASIWVFDAWAHEGDPLRRSFLESLINHFRSAGWVPEARWKRRLEELTHRARRARTTNVYEITWFAVALAIALVVSPIGQAGVREALPHLRLWLPGREFALSTTFWFILATSPLFVAGLAVAHSCWAARKDPSKRPLDVLGALLVQKSANQTRTTTNETTDPTSIEFETEFRLLMRDALSPSTRRVVLVIDNLDRVEPEDAQRIWSTLRTFLDPAVEARREEWLSRVWAIIPYDPEGIQRLWAGVHDGASNSSARVVTSFLDKTIDIRLHVPPALLSNWKDYLLELLRAALPNTVTREELHRVYRMLALAREGNAESPTPRELKIYVNQISALHRLRGDEFPISDLAYFGLLEKDGGSLANQLRSGQIPQPRYKNLISSDAAVNLAALYFGVDRAEGQQLLLRQPILDALASGDGPALLRLQELAPAIGATLEHVLSEAVADWIGVDSKESGALLTAAKCVVDAGVLDRLDHESHNHIRLIFSRAATAAEVWNPVSADTVEGILALNGLLRDPDAAFSTVRALSKTLSNDDTALEPATIGLMAHGLAEGLSGLGLSEALRSGITVPGGPEAYLDAFAGLMESVRAENDPDHPHLLLLRPDAEGEEIVEALGSRILSASFSQADWCALRLLGTQNAGLDWEPVTSAIEERFEGATLPKGADEVNLLLATLQHLLERRQSAAARQALHSVFSSGRGSATWAVVAGTNPEDYQARARLLYSQMLVDPKLEVIPVGTGGDVFQRELATPTPAVAACVAAICENADTRDLLLQVGTGTPKIRPLVAEVLRKLYERGKSKPFFSGALVAQHWALFPNDFPFRDFLVQEPNRASEIARHLEKGSAVADYWPLYRIVLDGLKHKKKFSRWLAHELQAVSAESWLEDLRGQEVWLKIAIELRLQGFDPDLSKPFRTSLLQYVEELRAGKTDPLMAPGDVLLDLMDKSDRAIFQDRIFENFLNSGATWSAEVYKVLGLVLRNDPRLGSDDRVLSRVLVPLVETRHAPGVQWIRQVVAERGNSLFDSLESQRVRAFRRAIAYELENGPSDQVHEHARFVARRLNIRRSSRGRSTRPRR